MTKEFEAECEVISMKVQHRFYRQSLFTYLAETDYCGEIKACGDFVRTGKKGEELVIGKQMRLSHKRIPYILTSIEMIDYIVNEMALELKTKIESEIIENREELVSKETEVYTQNIRNNTKIHVKSIKGLSFVGAIRITPVGEEFYDFTYLYGFKWGLE